MLKKYFFYLISYSCGAFLALLLSIGLLAASPSGSLWLVSTLSKTFAKNFHYEHFSGVLLKHFTLTGVHSATQHYDLTIAKLSLTWQPIQLLHLHLLIDQCLLANIHLQILSAAEEKTTAPTALQLPSWLSKIQIAFLQIDDVLFEQKAQEIALAHLSAALVLQKENIQLHFSWNRLHQASTHHWFNTMRLDGIGQIVGRLAHYDWLLNMSLNNQPLLLVGEGSSHAVQITHIQSAFFPKTLAFFARYQWFPEAAVTINTSGSIDPSIWSKNYHGHLAVQANFQAKKLFSAEALYTLTVEKCQGVLQGQNIKGSGQFIGSADGLFWKNWHFHIADALLDIQGVLGKVSHLIWHIDIKNLAYWIPERSGRIVSYGQIHGDWHMPVLQAMLDIDQLKLFDCFLHHLHVEANRLANKPEGVLDISLAGLSYQKYLISAATKVHMLAVFTPKHIRVIGNMTSDWGKVTLQGLLPIWQSAWLEQAIQGTLQWQLNNFPVFSNATLQNVQGALVAQANISGMVKAPKINCALEIHHASMKIVPLNIFLKNIRVSIKGWLDQTLKILVAADSTEGQLQAAGTIETLLSRPHLLLNILSNQLLVADLPSYKVWASSHLQLDYQQPKVILTGSIQIPKAKLKWIDYDKTVIQLSPDVRYVGEKQTILQIFSHLMISLGNAIHFSYGGLTGLLAGQALLQTAPDGPATALGKIYLKNGRYVAYGESLNIQTGVADFRGGDVLDPQLTVQATKLFTHVMSTDAVPGYAIVTNPDGSLTVGILISGSVSNYQIRLFSEPAGLSQSDILSYLILGVPAANMGSSGGQLLLSAASALADKGNGQLGPVAQLQNQLQETLGIGVNVGQVSQYNTNSQSVQQGTGLILTKKLSSKLSASYSAGIGQAINQLNVRYQINPHWMAQSNSSNLGNGGDIFYTINKY